MRRRDILLVGAASLFGCNSVYAGCRFAPQLKLMGINLEQESNTQSLNVCKLSEFGAKGDGSTDDTEAIQRAFNSKAAVIEANPGDMYLVRKAGTKEMGGYPANFCLEIGSHKTFLGNGARFKLADGANACVFALGNDNSLLENVTLKDFDIYGNRHNQEYVAVGRMPNIYVANARGLYLDNIRCFDSRDYAGRFLSVDRSVFGNLSSYGSDGMGWEFGTAFKEQWVTNSQVNNLYTENAEGTISERVPGNVATICGRRLRIGLIEGKNCAAGIKFQDSSEDIKVTQCKFLGGFLGTRNSGTKIQGGESGRPRLIEIKYILSENCFGPGLYIQDSEDVIIQEYRGKSNDGGPDAADGDVWLAGTRTTIKQIISVGALCRKPGAIYIRKDAHEYMIQVAIVEEYLGLPIFISESASGSVGIVTSLGGLLQ